MTILIAALAIAALVAFLAGVATRSPDLYALGAGLALVLVGLEIGHHDPVSAAVALVFVAVPLSLLWREQRRANRRTGGAR